MFAIHNLISTRKNVIFSPMSLFTHSTAEQSSSLALFTTQIMMPADLPEAYVIRFPSWSWFVYSSWFSIMIFISVEFQQHRYLYWKLQPKIPFIYSSLKTKCIIKQQKIFFIRKLWSELQFLMRSHLSQVFYFFQFSKFRNWKFLLKNPIFTTYPF